MIEKISHRARLNSVVCLTYPSRKIRRSENPTVNEEKEKLALWSGHAWRSKATYAVFLYEMRAAASSVLAGVSSSISTKFPSNWWLWASRLADLSSVCTARAPDRGSPLLEIATLTSIGSSVDESDELGVRLTCFL